ADEEALHAAANTAASDIEPAGPAKQLSDELEVLEAVRAASSAPLSPVSETMAVLAAVIAEALSCELGIAYLAHGDRLAAAELGWRRPGNDDEIVAALRDALHVQQ